MAAAGGGGLGACFEVSGSSCAAAGAAASPHRGTCALPAAALGEAPPAALLAPPRCWLEGLAGAGLRRFMMAAGGCHTCRNVPVNMTV